MPSAAKPGGAKPAGRIVRTGGGTLHWGQVSRCLHHTTDHLPSSSVASHGNGVSSPEQVHRCACASCLWVWACPAQFPPRATCPEWARWHLLRERCVIDACTKNQVVLTETAINAQTAPCVVGCSQTDAQGSWILTLSQPHAGLPQLWRVEGALMSLGTSSKPCVVGFKP